MNDVLETIASLAKDCDEALAVELNRRLQEILDWVTHQLGDLEDPETHGGHDIKREDRVRLMEALDDGRMPEGFKRHFIETGQIDCRLWPLHVPWTVEMGEPNTSPGS